MLYIRIAYVHIHLWNESAKHSKNDCNDEIAQKETDIGDQVQPMCRAEVEEWQHDEELNCQRDHSEDYLISTVRVVADKYRNENEVSLEVELLFAHVQAYQNGHNILNVQKYLRYVSILVANEAECDIDQEPKYIQDGDEVQQWVYKFLVVVIIGLVSTLFL